VSESWFVESEPATVRLDLSDGQWIEVKREISYGERERLNASALGKLSVNRGGGGSVEAGSEVGLDLATYNVERIVVWVAAWSLKYPDGRPVRVSRDAVRALRPERAQEIQQALDRHIEAMEALGKATPS
jgi:hypothetical protein